MYLSVYVEGLAKSVSGREKKRSVYEALICKYENSTCERKIPQSCIDESEIFSLEIFKITGKRNAHSSGFHNAQE